MSSTVTTGSHYLNERGSEEGGNEKRELGKHALRSRQHLASALMECVKFGGATAREGETKGSLVES